MSYFPANCKTSLLRTTAHTVLKGTDPCGGEKMDAPGLEKTSAEEVKNKLNLNLPVANSARKLVDEIQEVKTSRRRRIKSVSDIENGQILALKEKMTKQVNFPNDKILYKDLIPISIKTTSQPILPSREPLPQKDSEPQLSTFLKRKIRPEFKCKPQLQVRLLQPIQEYDGFRTYHLLQQW